MDQPAFAERWLSTLVSGPGRVLLEPELEHHENPGERPVVSGVLLQPASEQVVEQIRTRDIARAQAVQRVVRQLRQRRVAGEPGSDRQTEPVLLLGNDLLRQEAGKRMLEEPAQLRATQLVVRGQLGRQRNDRFG